MSREDANLIIAMAGLFVALVATGAAIYAIRRDRADLRVTTSDAGAGNRWVTVVNVGLRPVRIERILVRRWRLVPRLGKVIAIGASVVRVGGQEEPLPTVIQPAAEFVLHYWPAEYGEFVGPHEPDILVEDASGRRYPVRYAPDVHLGPLMALDMAKMATERRFREIIRAGLLANGGRPARARRSLDDHGSSSLYDAVREVEARLARRRAQNAKAQRAHQARRTAAGLPRTRTPSRRPRRVRPASP